MVVNFQQGFAHSLIEFSSSTFTHLRPHSHKKRNRVNSNSFNNSTTNQKMTSTKQTSRKSTGSKAPGQGMALFPPQNELRARNSHQQDDATLGSRSQNNRNVEVILFPPENELARNSHQQDDDATVGSSSGDEEQGTTPAPAPPLGTRSREYSSNVSFASTPASLKKSSQKYSGGDLDTSTPAPKLGTQREESYYDNYYMSAKSIGGYGSAKSIASKDLNNPKEVLDQASLILGMERTLFGALNNAWLLSVGGIGLMSVGSGDNRATRGGIAILIGGILAACAALFMHNWRVVQLRNNTPFKRIHTVIWASLVVGFTIICLIMELYFGVLYPYLNREAAVTIAGLTDDTL